MAVIEEKENKKLSYGSFALFPFPGSHAEADLLVTFFSFIASQRNGIFIAVLGDTF